MNAACTGFIYALKAASAFGRRQVCSGYRAGDALQVVNYADRSTCVLFGDGANAVVLGEETAWKYLLTECLRRSAGF